VVINQCNKEDYDELKTKNGLARMYSVKDRGLTKSRNMAIEKSHGDICLLCDDDEVFQKDYEQKILSAYEEIPDADIIIFKMVNRTPSFPDKVIRLKFPKIMKVSSWQISFKRAPLVDSSVRFDELLGAGTGNGAEEELKFLKDSLKAKLKIYYVPLEIASVGQESSTWFTGFTEKFFCDRGNTTRYILGLPVSVLYAFYYVVRKRNMYKKDISFFKALKAILGGIKENRLTKLSKNKGKL
jgi:glycosyltransferase involved in cell wall biosynthesis